MPGPSVSSQQFAVRNVMTEEPGEFDIPRPGSAQNWGSKRYTAWATGRGSATPLSGSKETMGSNFSFNNEE